MQPNNQKNCNQAWKAPKCNMLQCIGNRIPEFYCKMDLALTTQLVLDKLDEVSEPHAIDPTSIYLNPYQVPRAILNAVMTTVNKFMSPITLQSKGVKTKFYNKPPKS